MIIGVAIKDAMNGVWSLDGPNRHHHVFRYMFDHLGKTKAKNLLSNHVQGFIDHNGFFLDRKQAFLEARACNQILPPYNPINPKERRGVPDLTPRELFSEDLW